MTWAILGESVQGTSHRTRDTPCQDAFRYRVFGPTSEWLVIAVADGAGSASHSEIGSALVCDAFIRIVVSFLPGKFAVREHFVDLFTEVRNEVVAEAVRREMRPREFASTALLAIIGPRSASFAQLGDGAIVIGNDSGYRTVFWPEPAGYANATDFLTDENFADALHFSVLDEPVNAIATLTDGLQRLALDFSTRSPHEPFFRPLLNRLEKEADLETLQEPFRAFLDSQAVNTRTDDDKTLIIAVRSP